MHTTNNIICDFTISYYMYTTNSLTLHDYNNIISTNNSNSTSITYEIDLV